MSLQSIGSQINILMAVYNGAEYILPQLQSIMDQTYQDFHLTIRDNCSNDNTLALIENFTKKHPEKISLLKGSENLGAMGNFATLATYARAPYVMFSDGDDFWLPNKIADTFALMKRNEALYGAAMPLLVHTDLTVVDRNLGVIDDSFWAYSRLNPMLDSLNRLLVQNVVTGCTTLINQPLLRLALPIPKEAIMHDWWIGLVAAAFGRIDVLKKPTLLYRQHGKNDTGAKKWKGWQSYITAIKKAASLKGRDDLHQRLSRTILQADAFFQRYGKDLNLGAKQRKLVLDYISLSKSNALKKRYLIVKHRFYKNTLAKTIGMFVVI